MGVYFNGRYYIKPQVATYVDDTALTPVGLVGSNVIGMMGPAKDGVPNQAYLLTSLNDATDIFGEGPLVDGVAMAFNGGAQYIWATRVGGTYAANAFTSIPTQAIIQTTGNTTSPTTFPFRLLSKAYGTQANGILVTTTYASGRFSITVAAQQNTITGTGIGYDILSILNSGTSTDFTIATLSTAYNLTIVQGANTAPVIDLVGVASTTDLVARIKDAMANATPAAIDDTTFTFNVMKEVPGTELDALAFSAASATVPQYFQASMKAAFDWFNAGNQPYVYAEDSGNIFTTYATKSTSALAPRTINFALAAQAGAGGTIDSTSYTGVLAEIYEDLDLDLVVPIVDDYLGTVLTTGTTPDAVFTATLNHCKSMSTTKAEERIGLVGYQFTDVGGTTPDGSPETLVTTLMGKATAFNSPYIVVCSPRFKTFDIKGNLKYFNGTYTAAYIAGLIASFPVGEPITNKDVTGMQGLSTYFLNRHILQLIDNGVLVVERVGGALKVVQGVTSWVSDDNFNKKEISVRLVTNYIAKNCRENLKQFIGRKNSLQMLQIIKGSLVQVLRELENNEIIVGTPTYPAYRNLILTSDGDVVRVSFECSPVLPINYVLITIHATIFKATI